MDPMDIDSIVDLPDTPDRLASGNTKGKSSIERGCIDKARIALRADENGSRKVLLRAPISLKNSISGHGSSKVDSNGIRQTLPVSFSGRQAGVSARMPVADAQASHVSKGKGIMTYPLPMKDPGGENANNRYTVNINEIVEEVDDINETFRSFGDLNGWRSTCKEHPHFIFRNSQMILRQLLHTTSRRNISCFFLKPQLLSSIFTSNFSTSFLITKTPKKFRKKHKKKPSARTTLVQTQPNLIPYFENVLVCDAYFRFVTRTKDYLSKQTHQILRLDDAGKFHQHLGFPRGRKIIKYLLQHPLLFQVYRHTDNKIWLGFSDFMDKLLAEERVIIEKLENERLNVIRKLLMMSANKTIALSKIYHNRLLFGIPENLRDWILKFPDYFRVVVQEDGKRMLELVKWDNSLAVSALEKEFMVDEDKVKKAFKFPLKHRKALELAEDDERNLNMLNTLPLVSPYSDGSKLDLWSLEAEKYRIGVIHEFLSLTLEKRAYIHNIVDFKDEFSLTRQTYQILLKQPWTFYLAGTEMNWCVFLKDAYGEDGVLIDKDPQVVFNEKLYEYANKQEMQSNNDGSPNMIASLIDY